MSLIASTAISLTRARRLARSRALRNDVGGESIITKSSNIGAAKIGIRLGETKLYQYIRDFRLWLAHGDSTAGRSLWHRAAGQTLEQSFHRPDSHGPGRRRDAAANGHGHERHRQQGPAHAADDRGPAGGRDGKIVAKYKPQPVRQVISEAAAKQMVTALKTVPTAEGTRRGRPPGYTTPSPAKPARPKKWRTATTSKNTLLPSSDFFPRTIPSCAFPWCSMAPPGRPFWRADRRPGFQGHRRARRQLFEPQAGHRAGAGARRRQHHAHPEQRPRA